MHVLDLSIFIGEVVLLYIISWIALGLAGGWIASRKGYNPMLGVLVGVVLGPCGLIAGTLAPVTREGRQQLAFERRMDKEADEFNKRRPCPACKGEISARAPSAVFADITLIDHPTGERSLQYRTQRIGKPTES